jgi:hypothetical protein
VASAVGVQLPPPAPTNLVGSTSLDGLENEIEAPLTALNRRWIEVYERHGNGC